MGVASCPFPCLQVVYHRWHHTTVWSPQVHHKCLLLPTRHQAPRQQAAGVVYSKSTPRHACVTVLSAKNGPYAAVAPPYRHRLCLQGMQPAAASSSLLITIASHAAATYSGTKGAEAGMPRLHRRPPRSKACWPTPKLCTQSNRLCFVLVSKL